MCGLSKTKTCWKEVRKKSKLENDGMLVDLVGNSGGSSTDQEPSHLKGDPVAIGVMPLLTFKETL